MKLTGGALTLAFCLPLAALESISGAELLAACRDQQLGIESTRAASCRAYLLGYLSASPEIIDADERPSEFTARAIRTRATRLSNEAERRLNSRYCLPTGATLDDLAGKVAAESAADSIELAQRDAAVVMRRVFEKHYLCEPVAR